MEHSTKWSVFLDGANYSNQTQFGMTDRERYPWIAWHFSVVLCSFIGDTIILVSSIRYNAFTLHKIVVAFIQHLAVCDLLTAQGNTLPTLISTIMNSEQDSKIVLYTRFFFTYFTPTASSLLVSALALTKLLILKFPLRTRFLSTKFAQKLCCGIWLASLYIPAVHLVIDHNDIKFDFRNYNSMYRYSSKLWKVLLPLSSVLVLLAPNIVVIVSTVMLLRVACKAASGARKSLRWQGISTVVLTAAVYTVSYLPFNIYFTAEPYLEKDPDKPGLFHVEFYRVASGFVIFNVLANFFVYSLTVNSFRGFLMKACGGSLRLFSNKISSEGYASF